jgi:hypothetical protein
MKEILSMASLEVESQLQLLPFANRQSADRSDRNLYTLSSFEGIYFGTVERYSFLGALEWTNA